MTRSLAFILLLALAAQGCGETPRQFRPLPSALGDIRGVAMGFERLLPLGPQEGIYAGWIRLDNGDVVGLGTFNVNAAGQPINSEGQVIDRFSSGVSLFNSVSIVITVEPTGGAGPDAGGGAILQGPFLDGIAELRVPAPLFIEQASGSYRVFTPTDGPDTNENSGVWSVDTDGNPTLLLPPLNNVYSYEAYMVIDGQPVTMGRFLFSDRADFINFFSGPEPAPDVPGEDFLQNAPGGLVFPTDLSGTTLLLTLEPTFDDTVDPSQLVVLEAVMPAGLQGGETVALTNRTGSFPTGTAAIF